MMARASKNAHMKLKEDYSTPGRIKKKILKLCRDNKCKDIEQLCAMFGLDCNAVRYLCGKPVKTVDVIIKVCERCDVSADWLLGVASI